MSGLVRKNINGNEYLFVNTSRENRSGFVHETKLYRNDRLIGENKVQYYNRTWECYRYQTVMKGLVSYLMESAMEDFQTAWKESHGIKRLTKQKREIMLEDFQKNKPERYSELEEIYAML